MMMLQRLRDDLGRNRVVLPIPPPWRDRFDRIPARYKRLCFIVWVGWKFVALFLVLYVWPSSSHQDHPHHHQHPERLRPAAAASATQLHPPQKPQAEEVRPESPPKVLLMLVTVPSSPLLSTMHAAVARTVAVLDDFDVHVRWIVGDDDNDDENNDAEDDDEDNDATTDDDNHIYYWRDATPLYGGSLYRQERFVIKDALLSAMMATTIGATGTTAAAFSSTAFYDVVMALYRDDVVFLSNDVLHEYIRTSRRLLLLDSNNDHDHPHATVVVPHLPLVVSPDGVAATGTTTTARNVMNHPALGLARVYNDTTGRSSTIATSTVLPWGWMATPEQLFLSYRLGNFPLPPFEDAVAMNNDDALYVRVFVVSRISIYHRIPYPLFLFFILLLPPPLCTITHCNDTAGNAVLTV